MPLVIEKEQLYLYILQAILHESPEYIAVGVAAARTSEATGHGHAFFDCPFTRLN